MTVLFATPGMIIASILVFLVEFFSLVILCIGLLSYRHIVMSHRAFLSSLHHGDKEVGHKSTGVLFWIYLLSTFLFVLLTSAIYLWQPRFF